MSKSVDMFDITATFCEKTDTSVKASELVNSSILGLNALGGDALLAHAFERVLPGERAEVRHSGPTIPILVGAKFGQNSRKFHLTASNLSEFIKYSER